MKILLDSCVWEGVRDDLTRAGHDVIWVGDWDKDPGDEEILNRAYADSRVLVTLDNDFGELIILRKMPHNGIIRLVGFGRRQQSLVCLRVLALYNLELQAGAIITAEPDRTRIRPPDNSGSNGAQP